MPLTIGDAAPDFELDSHLGRKVRLSSYRGRKHVVIAFHPLAWTPVCARQMAGYEAEGDWFAAHDTVVLGVSVDAVPSKVEWAKSLGGISYRPSSATSIRTAPWRLRTASRGTAGSRNAPSSLSTRRAPSSSRRSTTSPPCPTTPKCARRIEGLE